MDFFKFKNNQPPQRGSLLISEPFLPDPNFERTVVLLCEHGEEGSFGFVLNKGSHLTLAEIMPDMGGLEARVFIGGPVQQDTLHFIHKSDALEGGTEISNGIFWGGNFEQLMVMIDTKQIDPEDFMFFVGYSGWGEGQLEDEIKADSWIVANYATPQLVFTKNGSDLWKIVLKQLGGRYNVYSNYPTDPRLN